MRIRHTLLDQFRFEDVRWHSAEGRLQLQDELDLNTKEDKKDPIPPELAGFLLSLRRHLFAELVLEQVTHEVVADTYRRLTNNFEKYRQYESAEQSICGTFEMRRLNPDTP
jgi:hypothetical protein